MKKREPVSHIMTTEITTVNVKQSLREVAKIFEENKFRHLPVVSGEDLVGIISKTDILRISYGSNFGAQEKQIDDAIFDMLSIPQVMQTNLHTIEPSTPIREAAEILSQAEFHALPVVEGKKLVGIVTTTDIIKYLLEQY
ncbi:MAG: CBS domain-containing protein [Bacteroidia bacterium]|nr:CBS domain-containing protein [Bacteroidia bacterium]MDW8157451.1 CBS domain-containing protein [Bacteroidia bacterium]